MRNNITVFPIQATQYISGSGPTLRLAEYDITVRHDTNKKIFKKEQKKQKLALKYPLSEN